MRTMVFDVPAAESGAMSILREYHEKALATAGPDHEWIFVIGLPELASTPYVKIQRYPWVKKSWLHRLWFDHLVAPRLVRAAQPDHILSLQNLLVPHVTVPQDLYLHQPMPFTAKRFRLFTQPVFWLYQNVLSRPIYRSVRRARRVTVQTQWMKDACVRLAQADPGRIDVVPPRGLDTDMGVFEPGAASLRSFFYPTSEKIYKDHTTLVHAIAQLPPAARSTIRLAMTLTGAETRVLRRLRRKSDRERLPIEWLGMIPHTEVMARYTRSVLVFPSYIETFGLPLLEARRTGAPVIAADCAFAREILAGCPRAAFFPPEDAAALSRLLRQSADGTLFPLADLQNTV